MRRRHVVALVDARHHIVELPDDRLRRDAMLRVVGRLHRAAALGLADARLIESVIVSAYMMTRPLTLRAARPEVWISEPADRRNPSLSASRMATSDTSGRSSPSRSRLMPTRTSNSPRRRSRRISHPLERLDVGVQVAHAHPEPLVVLRQVLSHPLGEGRHQHALALRGHAAANLAAAGRPPAPSPAGRRSADRSGRSAG